MPKISIIIVNFNTSSLLIACLKSLFAAIRFARLTNNSEVIVVDNASVDESNEKVVKEFPQVILLANKENVGFAKANNQGIHKAKGEYVLLLNSDTEVKKDTLRHLLNSARLEKNLGVLGGKLFNMDGTIQFSLGFFPSISRVFFWMSFLDDIPLLSSLLTSYHIERESFYDRSHEVDWVSGACFLIRKEVGKKVGLFDENIFMYGEEVEWCYRIKKRGFRIVYTPTAHVFHKKGGSGENGREGAGIVEEFSSLLYFYKKHKKSWERKILRILLIFGALLRILVFGIMMRNLKKAKLYAKAIQLVRQ